THLAENKSDVAYSLEKFGLPVSKASQKLGIPAKEMVSGAGHDAVYISKVAPTSMIFIPCKDGLSHNELESATREDVIDGANVLLHAVLELAQK
ncbi:MAG: M20/M25/M40 family metallo-hydrolase, partial [Bacteroidota bacterium]